MTVLPPDIPVLPRLERIGAELLVADMRRPEVLAEARAKAVAELDGMYDVTRETAGLIRTLQAACEIEARANPPGPIRINLNTAVWHLKRAAVAVRIAMSRQQVERELDEAEARAGQEFLAKLNALLADGAAAEAVANAEPRAAA